MLKFLDRLRGGTNIVVVLEADGQIGIATCENDDEASLSDAVSRANLKISQKAQTTIDLIQKLSQLGGDQLIKNTIISKETGEKGNDGKDAENSEEVEKLKSLCTDKQASVINSLCSELGIDPVEVKDSMSLASYYCLQSALTGLVNRS